MEQRIVTHSLSTGRLSGCGTKELVGWGRHSDVPGARYEEGSAATLYNVFTFTSSDQKPTRKYLLPESNGNLAHAIL